MIKKLEEFRVYEMSMSLGEDVWNIVEVWTYQKDTVGKQLVKAVDSIAANLSEGFGRYHFKDIKNFGYFSRGSLSETKTWLKKSLNRKLIDQSEHQRLTAKLDSIGKMLNIYIKSVGTFNTLEPKPQPPSPKP